MYKAFYGLSEKPFSKTPDPRFLYLSGGHREALARLEYAVEECELALLTGEIGCGKTTLSRALMDRVGERYHFLFVINPRLSADELLRVIAQGLAVEAPSLQKDQLLGEITGALYRLHGEGRIPVVVIDETDKPPLKPSDTSEAVVEPSEDQRYQAPPGGIVAVVPAPAVRMMLWPPVVLFWA